MFSHLLSFFCAHRFLVWSLTLVLLCMAGILVLRGPYDTRLDGIFSKGSASERAMSLLMQSGLSDQLILDIDATERTAGLDDEAIRWMETLAGNLRILPGIQEVTFHILPDDLGSSLSEIVRALPQLLPPPENRNPKEICTHVLRQLMTPTPSVTDFLRNDPYGLLPPVLQRLDALRKVSGLRFDATKSFLCSQDQRHALIRLTLSIPYSDTGRTAELLQEIRQQTSCAPEGICTHLLGAAVHTLGNEQVIRHDLKFIGYLSPLFLILLFLIVFRGDWRCIWIPIIPAGALILATGLLAALSSVIQLFVLGLGGSILGLAVDQGIHIYLACQPPRRFETLSRLASPLALSAGTSIAVFALLMALHSPALCQLGFLAASGLLLSLAANFFLLPTVLAPEEKAGGLCPKNVLHQHSLPQLPHHAAWLLLLLGTAAAMTLAATRLRCDFDVRSMDGSPKDVWADEALYAEIWMPHTPPMLLLRSPESPAAQDLLTALAAHPPVQPADFWPDATTRQANLASWRSCDLTAWEEPLRAAARDFHLQLPGKADFFGPFFENIRQGLANPPETPPAWLGTAYNQLRHNDIAILFPSSTEGIQEILDRTCADAALITPDAFRRALIQDFGHQLTWLAIAACVVIGLLALLLLHSLRDTILATLPVLATLLWTAGLLTLCGRPVTLMVAIAGMLLLGLAIDYGVFLAHWKRENFAATSTIPKAMTLSASTTVFTALLLLFSQHPVLFDIGLVLSCGIGTAYIFARFLLPAILQRKIHASVLIMLLGVTVFLSSCTTYPRRAEISLDAARQEIAVTHQDATQFQAKVTVHFLWIDLPMLVAGTADNQTRLLKMVCLSTSGATLLQFQATPEEIHSLDRAPLLPERTQWLLEKTALGLARTFLDNTPDVPDSAKWSHGGLRFAKGERHYLYAGNPLVLWQKGQRHRSHRSWLCKRLSPEGNAWIYQDFLARVSLEIQAL